MTPFAALDLPVAPADPRKHVNYELGMVLGVDDFRQEFAYLSGRDKRVVRDLLGGGVVCGLRVRVEPAADDRGPRVHVSPGEAVTPSGQLVCVSPAQCAYLNEWAQAHRAELEGRTSPVRLSVVACHRECPTDDVPIPGEPCRSEDELMKPSRLLDDFSLDLRLESPVQLEEEAVRAFVAWVQSFPLGAGAGDVPAFLGQIRAALEVPGVDPLEFLKAPPPAGLEIPAGDPGPHRRALLAFWVAELRPRLRSEVPGAECGCGAGGPGELSADADCITLAVLEVPIVPDAVSGQLEVPASPAVVVDEGDRGTLLHMRLLQEWLLAVQEAQPLPLSGRFGPEGETVSATPGLTASRSAADKDYYLVSWPGYREEAGYVVLGQPITEPTTAAAPTFEVVAGADHGALFEGGDGVAVRIRGDAPGGFMVRIEELGA